MTGEVHPAGHLRLPADTGLRRLPPAPRQAAGGRGDIVTQVATQGKVSHGLCMTGDRQRGHH